MNCYMPSTRVHVGSVHCGKEFNFCGKPPLGWGYFRMDKRGAIAVIAFVYTFRVGAWPIEKKTKKEMRPLWSALHIFKLVRDLRKRKNI